MRSVGKQAALAALAVGFLLALACGGGGDKQDQAAVSTPQGTAAAAATAKPQWQVEWENTVEAAKKEKLVIVTHPGEDYEALIAAFRRAYPGITVEHSGLRPSEFSSRLLTEQTSGLYAWDVWTTSTSNMNNVVMPAGGFREVAPFLLLPEVTDASKWRAGLQYSSEKGKFILLHSINVTATVWVNRNLLPKDQFSSVDQLLDAKLKGKISVRTPSGEHSGSLTLTGFLHAKGEDFVRRLSPRWSRASTAPWMALAPGIAITTVVLAFNLLGDALRDILDPRLKGTR